MKRVWILWMQYENGGAHICGAFASQELVDAYTRSRSIPEWAHFLSMETEVEGSDETLERRG